MVLGKRAKLKICGNKEVSALAAHSVQTIVKQICFSVFLWALAGCADAPLTANIFHSPQMNGYYSAYEPLEIEFPFVKNGVMPYINLLANGKKATFLVDTGADGISMVENAIDKFGLKKVGMFKNKKYTAQGLAQFEGFGPVSLQITPTVTFTYPAVQIIANHHPDMDGIIGSSLLALLACQIDFQQRKVKCSKQNLPKDETI